MPGFARAGDVEYPDFAGGSAQRAIERRNPESPLAYS